MLRLATLSFLAVAAAAQGGNVIAFQPDRIVQHFTESGSLLSQTAYRDGRKVGRFVSFWPDGQRRVEALYTGDTINGVYRSWHANGRLAELRHYLDGHERGSQQAWTDRGELFLNFEVRNGRHYGLTNSQPCVPVRGTM